MSISLCMIVKDEEKYLRKCLKSVLPLVDEIIVVDTGSRDATIGIASQFGAIVKKFNWVDDFSLARNFSLGLATKDWILVLDADETIDEKYHPMIRELEKMNTLTDDRIVGYQFRVMNHTEELAKEHYCLRMFPNNQGLRYQFAIHEQLYSPYKKALVTQKVPGIVIDHVGYHPDLMKSRKKHERNRDILIQETRRFDRAFDWHNLGVVYMSEGKDVVALDCFNRVADKVEKPYPNYYAHTLALAQSICIRNKNYEGAYEWCIEEGNDEKNPDYLLHLGLICTNFGEHDAAIGYIEQAIDLRGQESVRYSICDHASMGWKAYAALGNAWAKVGNLHVARQYYQAALSQVPEHKELKKAVEDLSKLT